MYKDVLLKQLALEFNTTLEKINNSNLIITEYKSIKGSRFKRESFLRIVVYAEKLFIMCNRLIIDWCNNYFINISSEWISEPESINEINNYLKAYDKKIIDMHHYYLPVNDNTINNTFDLNWYKENEINAFGNDNRFSNAILFDENIPDMLAVTAVEGDKILGMAGSTKNSKLLWEIGVDTTIEGKGRGVASLLVSHLKKRILNMGIIPYYGTVESHIKSQRVAIRAGFEPAYFELFTD